jgi:hypothetical protein
VTVLEQRTDPRTRQFRGVSRRVKASMYRTVTTGAYNAPRPALLHHPAATNTSAPCRVQAIPGDARVDMLD